MLFLSARCALQQSLLKAFEETQSHLVISADPAGRDSTGIGNPSLIVQRMFWAGEAWRALLLCSAPPSTPVQGDVVLVAMEYEDGWSRGMKLETKEVGARFVGAAIIVQ